MSDSREVLVGEPEPVDIPLDTRSIHSRHSSPRSSRRSSSSTSSFEDVKPETKLTRSGSTHSTKSTKSNAAPPTIVVEELTPQSASKGALTFKTTSLDDPTYYAQLSSSSGTPPVKAARIHTRGPPKFRPADNKAQLAEDDRDPENVNDCVKIRFEEIFAEPEGTYSFGTIWGASFKLFNDSKLWCYKFLSALCAVPCALCWGMHFACLSFCQIWWYQPGLRSFSIQVKPAAKVYGVCVKSFIEPCFDAFARMFGGIRVNVSRD